MNPTPPVRQRVYRRNQRLRELGYSSYDAYLSSPHWRRLRVTYQESGRPIVCICGDTEDLDYHHKTYDRLGAEDLDDLTPLCRRCHAALHTLERRGVATLDPVSLTDSERQAVNRIVEQRRAATARRQREKAHEERAAKFDTLPMPQQLAHLLLATKGHDAKKAKQNLRLIKVLLRRTFALVDRPSDHHLPS